MRHPLGLLHAVKHKFRHERGDRVAVQHDIFSLVQHGKPHSVAVGVRKYDNIGFFPLGFLDCQFKGLRLLRVGRRAGGKFFIGEGLSRNGFDFLDSRPLQNTRNHMPARAVERRIHHLHVLCGQRRNFPDRVEVIPLYLVRHILDFFFFQTTVEVSHRHGKIFYFGHFRGNFRHGRVVYLTARVVIKFEAVVFLGIVTRGEHNSAVRSERPNCKRQKRRGLHCVRKKHLDTGVCQNARCNLRKALRVVAAVKANGNRLRFFPVEKNRICFDGAGNRVNVDAVGACAQLASYARCSERQILKKAIFFGNLVAFEFV